MDKHEIAEQIESFNTTITPEIAEIIDNCEDLEAFSEWLEKVNGDVKLANKLYGLPVGFPSPKNPELLTDWREWSYEDPADPRMFECPLCDEIHHIVNVDPSNYFGSDILALNEYGYLRNFEFIGDSSGDIYNYECDYTESEYRHICEDCAGELRADRTTHFWSEEILYQSKNHTVEITSSSHIAYRPPEYWDLSSSEREIVDKFIQYDESETGWKRIEIPTKSARNWVRNWHSFPDNHEYNSQFPTIIKVELCGHNYGNTCLWVPDDENAIEEANEWMSYNEDWSY